MTDQNFGDVTNTVTVRDIDLVLTVRGNGRCTIIVGPVREEFSAPELVAVLCEVARARVPSCTLKDVGPGFFALQNRVEELEALVSRALADHEPMRARIETLLSDLAEAQESRATIVQAWGEARQNLAEAEAANAALEGEVQRLSLPPPEASEVE